MGTKRDGWLVLAFVILMSPVFFCAFMLIGLCKGLQGFWSLYRFAWEEYA